MPKLTSRRAAAAAVAAFTLAAGTMTAGTAAAGEKGALFSFGQRRASAACDAGCGDVGCGEVACEAPARRPAPAPVIAPSSPPPMACVAPQPVACDSCDGSGCDSRSCRACNKDCMKGVKWHSEEWYAQRAHLPPGERQRIKKGKFWLVEPRPCGIEEQPFWHKYHTNKTWPHPYNCADRGSVHAAMIGTTERGWMRMTTLQAYHFEPSTHDLNYAGQQALLTILHNVPTEYRTAYVAAYDRPTAEARMASVEAAIVDMVGSGQKVAVLPRATTAYGRPAEEVDRINRAALEAMPKPTLAGGGGGGPAPQ